MGACMSSGGGDTIEARTNRDLEKMIKEVSSRVGSTCRYEIGWGLMVVVVVVKRSLLYADAILMCVLACGRWWW